MRRTLVVWFVMLVWASIVPGQRLAPNSIQIIDPAGRPRRDPFDKPELGIGRPAEIGVPIQQQLKRRALQLQAPAALGFVEDDPFAAANVVVDRLALPFQRIDFRKVALAQIMNDQDAITLALPSTEIKMIEGTVPVTKLRIEKRTRVVGRTGPARGRQVVRLVSDQRTRIAMKDGQRIEQEYTVQVPVTAWIQDETQAKGERKPGDSKEDADAETDAGNPVTEEYEVQLLSP